MTLDHSVYNNIKSCLNYNILSHLSKSIDVLRTYAVAGMLYENVYDPICHRTWDNADRPILMKTIEFIYDT